MPKCALCGYPREYSMPYCQSCYNAQNMASKPRQDPNNYATYDFVRDMSALTYMDGMGFDPGARVELRPAETITEKPKEPADEWRKIAQSWKEIEEERLAAKQERSKYKLGNMVLQGKLSALEDQLQRERAIWNREKWKLSKQVPALAADMIMNLILLCHPDKHNNSELATKVTQYLLSLRGKKK
jgi:hypothetical protein